MGAANLALRFVLELCAFAGLAYWGAWIAPKAPSRLLDPARLEAESAVFAVATVAIGASAGVTWGAGFAALVLLNELLMLRWGQRDTA